ncbi:MAG TPA: hypothetical protein DD473_07220 [Planctomycetaceae bacterium]|nr:hypothetical protein [Planctomycetaceae bacterium]|tara:strand:+ start:124 stop:369 length:246 start_codon:yes stop_codon:yes gene_type:complete
MNSSGLILLYSGLAILAVGQIWFAITISQQSKFAAIMSFTAPLAVIMITCRNWSLMKKPFSVCFLGYLCIFSGALIANSFV